MPKKSELKKVSETYKDLTRINGKDSEIDGQIKNLLNTCRPQLHSLKT